MSRWLLINGSPRLNGNSARVLRLMKMHLEANHPEIDVVEFDVGSCDVLGCNGCDYCKTDDECIIDDDMNDLIEEFQTVDRVILVTPIYFAGVPSQLKAVLDRLQQLYWSYCAAADAGELPSKRPATLVLLGDGGDPFGHEHAVALVKSAFAIAGLRLDEIIPLIGLKRITLDSLGTWGGFES